MWVTTAFTSGKLGPLDKLYTESIEKQELLDQLMQAYVLGCAVEAKEIIFNQRDDGSHAAGGAAGKKTPKKAEVDASNKGITGAAKKRRSQMTDLLGDLRAFM